MSAINTTANDSSFAVLIGETTGNGGGGYFIPADDIALSEYTVSDAVELWLGDAMQAFAQDKRIDRMMLKVPFVQWRRWERTISGENTENPCIEYLYGFVE